MSEPYKFLNLPEPRPVSEVMADAKAKGDASKEAAADKRGKIAAGAIAGAVAVGTIAAANYALENDPVTQKYKAQEQEHVADAGAQTQSLPEDPRDLTIEVTQK